jgi:hypothetical protein
MGMGMGSSVRPRDARGTQASPGMNDHDIAVTIDEVVLDAPFGARSGALREALAAHLTRLVAERGLPRGADLHLPRVRIDVAPELATDVLAARVAEQLYGQLAHPGGEGGGRRR